MPHVQSSLSELPPHNYVTSAPQASSAPPSEGFKDQLASILREFGLEPKGKARAYQKPYPDFFLIRRLILAVLEFLILLSLRGKMVDLLLSMWDNF